MSGARARAIRKVAEPKYANGILDDLMVISPFAELGYTTYHQQLSTNPDWGYIQMSGRFISLIGGDSHRVTDNLVRDALKFPNWKRLLVLEHDHVHPPDVFRRHAQYTDPIVAGMYFLRDIEAPLPTFFMWDKERWNCTPPDAAKMNEMLKNPGLYPMDTVPLGCTSIRRDVLERWPKDQPYFTSYTSPSGSGLSQDIFFCRVAQDDLGITPMLDSGLNVSHYALVPIDKDYFIRWYNTIGYKRSVEELERKQITEQVAASDAEVVHMGPRGKYAKVV